MEQLAQIKQVCEDGMAVASVVRQSACSGDCHQCSGCGAVRETIEIRAVNTIGAKIGDMVIVSSDSRPVLAGAAMLYLLPLALFFAGYLAGQQLGVPGALAGGIAFLLGMTGAVAYDRLVAKKQNQVYTITGYPAKKAMDSQIKGDNDLD